MSEISSSKPENFEFNAFIFKYRFQVSFALIGLILIGLGALLAKDSLNLSSSKVEILDETTDDQGESLSIVVEIAGAVENPGVYEFEKGDRIEDSLIAAGGISAEADREWMEKYLNRAAKITDGQKIYIPRTGEQTTVQSANVEGVYQNVSSGKEDNLARFININTATQKQLESLWGIGPVYAQNIIEHRPYSSVEELLSKEIIKQNVYERNKELLTVY